MLAELLEHCSLPPAAGFLLGKQCDGAVEPNREDLFRRFEIGVGAAMLDEGAVAAEAGDDRLAPSRDDRRPRAAVPEA